MSQQVISPKCLKHLSKLVGQVVHSLRKRWPRMTTEDQQDLCQDGLLIAIDSLKAFDNTRALTVDGWIRLTLQFRLRDAMRKLASGGMTELGGCIPSPVSLTNQAPEAGEDSGDDPCPEAIDSVPAMEESLELSAENAQAIDKLRMDMPIDDYLTLQAYYGLDGGTGLTVDQLADEMGVSRKTAFKRLQAAQAVAKKLLVPRELESLHRVYKSTPKPDIYSMGLRI